MFIGQEYGKEREREVIEPPPDKQSCVVRLRTRNAMYKLQLPQKQLSESRMFALDSAKLSLQQ